MKKYSGGKSRRGDNISVRLEYKTKNVILIINEMRQDIRVNIFMTYIL